jgi:hypothetical protein
MDVITKTSKYELTKDEEGHFKLMKTAIKEGCESKVPVGEIFTGDYAEFNAFGNLYIGDMRTSKVENRDDVLKFILT